MTPEPEILLDGVSKRFSGGRESGGPRGSPAGEAGGPRGSPAAVDAVTLSVARGEIVVVVGPSGCGKSTTLRLVAGLEEPDEGAIAIAGRSMKGVAPQDRTSPWCSRATRSTRR